MRGVRGHARDGECGRVTFPVTRLATIIRSATAETAATLWVTVRCAIGQQQVGVGKNGQHHAEVVVVHAFRPATAPAAAAGPSPSHGETGQGMANWAGHRGRMMADSANARISRRKCSRP